MTWLEVGSYGSELGVSRLTVASSEDTPRTQVQDLVAIEEELRSREGRKIPRLTDSPAYSEPHGIGRGAHRSL
jgi:hypothetical protein